MIALDLTAAGRSCGRGETRRRPRKTSGQEDRQEGGAGGGRGNYGAGTSPEGGAGGGRGNYGAGTSPAGALAHVPCCHTKGGSIRVGLKDGGKKERVFFFPIVLANCAPDGPKWTAQNFLECRGEG